MPIATASSLTVRYGPKTVLSDFSVVLPEGSVGLLGPNGAGKTTLLKTWLGFLSPVHGDASVLGLDTRTASLQIRQRIGLMPELDCHIPGMNAVTYIAYVGELCGMPGNHALRRAHEVLEYCGLGEARYRFVETYSTGMKQRIKLAQALVHGPRLLFLDEPTNGLDPEGRTEMLRLIRDISHGKGIHVVVCSHLLPDVEQTCDRVVVMRDGRIATEGSVEDLRKLAGVHVDVELREPSQAFLDLVAREGGTVSSSIGSRCRVALPSTTTDPTRALLAMAQSTGAQIRAIRPARRSLEDIFMEAVS
ncbi:MAG: ABC transporter ATP-binding protein [Chthonomonadales bacterium]|nr:ABC transporter ATP-binding protein [Chthonomonadales bacterium]